MVKKEVAKAAAEMGLDTDWVLGTYKRAAEVAEANGDAGSMIRAAKEVGDLLDMKPAKEGGFDPSHMIAGVDEDFSKTFLAAQRHEELPQKAVETSFEEIRPDAPKPDSN